MHLRSRWIEFRTGLHYHHPICCTLRYALARYSNRSARRGSCTTEKAGTFVPCGILHRSDDPPRDDYAYLRGVRYQPENLWGRPNYENPPYRRRSASF